jgi:hypothetical protein
LQAFNYFPLWQRGIKGDLKSLSISLYEREMFGARIASSSFPGMKEREGLRAMTVLVLFVFALVF